MAITSESAIRELREAIPSFVVDGEWERDRLSYPVFNDFARFICSEGEVLEYVKSADEAHRMSQVPLCMQFLERLLSDGDSDVRHLVRETIETLSTCPCEQKVKKWAGPQVSALWNLQPWR
jgi:hypothetical protein